MYISIYVNICNLRVFIRSNLNKRSKKHYPAKMAEKRPRFGGPWAGVAKLGAGVDNELGRSALHQCR